MYKHYETSPVRSKVHPHDALDKCDGGDEWGRGRHPLFAVDDDEGRARGEDGAENDVIQRVEGHDCREQRQGAATEKGFRV